MQKISTQCQRLSSHRAVSGSVALMALSTVIFALWSASFFRPERIGVDYVYFLPHLLAGDFWLRQNGIFSIPYFIPSFCGGTAFLPNPQSVYFSLPQLLFSTFQNGPTSLHLTLIASSTFGAIWMFIVSRRALSFSLAASTIAFVLFQWNGYLLYRLIIGHLTHHAFGLFPLMLWAALPGNQSNFATILSRVMICAVAIAYMIFCGAANMIGPSLVTAAVSISVLCLLHQTERPNLLLGLAILSLGAVAAIPLSAVKLFPMIQLVSAFPRQEEIIVTTAGLDLLQKVAFGLFVPGHWGDSQQIETRLELINLGRHEFEFGISVVPLIAMGAILARWLSARRAAVDTNVQQMSYIGLIIVVVGLAIPPILNVDWFSGWSGWLKTVPYVNGSVVQNRWFQIYLLPALVITVFVANNLRIGLWCATGASVLIIGQTLLQPRAYYDKQRFDPGNISYALSKTATSGEVPPIKAVGGLFGEDGLAMGQSSSPCYEPIFGYHGETAPKVGIGPISSAENGRFNILNPACLIFGDVNKCSIGDSFKVSDETEMQRFLSYKQFSFNIPWWQVLANYASGISVLSILGALMIFLCRRLARWKSAVYR